MKLERGVSSPEVEYSINDLDANKTVKQNKALNVVTVNFFDKINNVKAQHVSDKKITV